MGTMPRRKREKGNIVLHLSTYPPRECGIATFTHDLTTAFDKRFNPVTKSRVVAINESSSSFYNYGSRAVDKIAADSLDHYVALAERINQRDEIKIVNIQHEFGLFGGEWGDYLIPFLQAVRKPVIITFHSVLPDPDDYLRKVVKILCEKASGVVVMNELSRSVLVRHYGVPRGKIHVIPHGIPSIQFEPSATYKAALGFDGKIVLSTFGLLSPNKGIEYAIRALPKVIKKFPNLVYLVIGETHPVVRRVRGEQYRNFLMGEVERLKLQEHVKFYNKYLSLEEIITYLKATDVYVSSALCQEQSVSGTLSYALGAGRPVVSTPTSYARYIINGHNGVLVKFRNASSIAKALCSILEDEKKLKQMSGAAYEATRKMIWPNVAAAYFELYKKHADLGADEKKLPEIKLDHVLRLTDEFGMLHHAKYTTPKRRYGYSLDDNARALIVVTKCYERTPREDLAELMRRYLKFLRFSQKRNGGFARLVTSQRKRDLTHDDDVLGRGIWALGYVLSRDFLSSDMRRKAATIFRNALPLVSRISSPRAIAFAMNGLSSYLKEFPQKGILRLFTMLANRQVRFYQNSATEQWRWFEDRLTYSNSSLPESLYLAAELTGEKRYLDIAEESMKFLTSVTFEDGKYVPIGQAGWYVRNKERSYFDQQPEDTAAMVLAKTTAYRVTGNSMHARDAFTAFQWFLGKNHLNQMVYDEATGGCYDGVGRYALNLNQGAESTVSYLLARLAIEEIKDAIQDEL